MFQKVCSLFVVVWSTTFLHAENWRDFRGPTGQGLSQTKGLPSEWSDSKNVVWKQPIPGAGWSSPIINDGLVFLTAAVPVEDSKDQSLRALCLDIKTGKILGAMESPGHWIHATPDKNIFIGSLTGNVFRWYPGWLERGLGRDEGLKPAN